MLPNHRTIAKIAPVLCCLGFLVASQAQGACVYPTTVQFGVADNFAPIPTDPIPYNPALPEFVTYLNGLGIPTASMKTFDDTTSNHHMVATLRHGLRGCFPGAISLKLCFRAKGHSDLPGNDTVAIYNTDFGVYSFPVVYASAFVPTLIASWTNGSVATLCIDLTSQMIANQIGDMLQFKVQDDTAVDFTMTLN